jgi:hypothetical protein
MVMSARQLAYSCRLYEDCLNTLHAALRNQMKVAKSQSGKIPSQISQSYQQLKEQIQQDVDLLQSIKDEIGAVADGVAISFACTVIFSAVIGRQQKIKHLEDRLMSRVQLITSFMMKDIYKARIMLMLICQISLLVHFIGEKWIQ